MRIIRLFSVLTALLGACRQDYTEPTNAEPTTRRVAVEPLRLSKAPLPIVASGVLSSRSEATLSFKVGGVVQRVDVEEGQYVKQGQLLASLNLAEINAQVAQARNAYEKAGRDRARVERLFADSAATLEQRQDAQTGLEVAKAAYDIAAFNRRYARIVAPIDGKILAKDLEPNELVAPGQPVLTLGSSGQAGAQVISVGLADRDVVKVQRNDTARVTFDALPGRSFRARVTQMSEAANPNTGTFEVELTLEGPYEPLLRNGFVGKVALYPLRPAAHYRIPMDALVEGHARQARVYLTRDRRVAEEHLLAVEGIHADFFTVSANTLAANEQRWVVTQGAAYLRDQDSISVVNP